MASLLLLILTSLPSKAEARWLIKEGFETGRPMLAAIITLPNVFVNSNPLGAPQLNTNFQTIYNDYNGNITNANIAAGAGITLGKLSLNQSALLTMATGNQTWGSGLTGDTAPRVGFTSDGGLNFGPGGSTSPDTTLARSGVNALSTTAGVTVGSLAATSPITVPSGGTGLATLPSGKILLGAGTSSVGALTPTANQFVMGNSGATGFQMSASQQAALNLIAPTATLVGQAITWNGTNWVAGNNPPRFISTAQTPASGATFTLPHGLTGIVPTKLYTVWQCLTINAGFAVGDRVTIYPCVIGNAATSTFTMQADGTNVYMYMGTGTGAIPNFVNKSTNAQVQITLADWEIFVYAEP